MSETVAFPVEATPHKAGHGRLLMCPHRFFNVHYEINPWMDANREIDGDLAWRQWRALYRTLVEQVGVEDEQRGDRQSHEEQYDSNYNGRDKRVPGWVTYKKYDIKPKPTKNGRDHNGTKPSPKLVMLFHILDNHHRALLYI